MGKKAAQQFAGLSVGSKIGFRDSDWTVVGIFETGGDVHESEIWADAETTMSAFRRTNYQSVTARLADGSDAGFMAFKDVVSRDPRFSLSVLREPEYYARQARVLSNLINILGYTVAAFMATRRHVRRAQLHVLGDRQPPGRDRHAAGASASAGHQWWSR